jgi:hypothetical protein
MVNLNICHPSTIIQAHKVLGLAYNTDTQEASQSEMLACPHSTDRQTGNTQAALPSKQTQTDNTQTVLQYRLT